MKALIVIDIPEDHLAVTLNDLYDRLNGYKCDLKPMPSRKDNHESEMVGSLQMDIGYTFGWNDCLDAITGETE
jgi:hypothetical protein